MADLEEKIQSWTDNDLESFYVNIVRVRTDEKSSPELIEKAIKNLITLEAEWKRRQRLAANNERTPDRPENGMLKRLGYHVGNEGVKPATRRIILEHVVGGTLPFVPHPAYVDEWGEPATEKRLQKLATTIASLMQEKKKLNDESYAKAIIEWGDDLEWLHKKYYLPDGYKFSWPKS